MNSVFSWPCWLALASTIVLSTMDCLLTFFLVKTICYKMPKFHTNHKQHSFEIDSFLFTNTNTHMLQMINPLHD